ncbi:MAG TPA: PQQ-binding-like beta-propeller repeat protein [Candidatus Saccharimonadales bacterium]|nr:PQQ-binding-like beta-propeller repeat protein [Candidatus Saccharimonadales bacterium]
MNENVKEETTANPASQRTNEPVFRPLRAWPGVLLAVLILAARFGPEMFEDAMAKYWMVSVFGPLLCCLLLLIWWLAASRATWRERLFGFLGIVAGAAIAVGLAHPTMRGAATTYLTIPMGLVFFAVAAAFLRKHAPAVRTGTAVLLAFAGFAASTLLRNEGMTGDYKFSWHSRWKQSAEETMLASNPKPSSPNAADTLDRSVMATALANPEWPGFRGAERDGRYRGPKISTNWSTQPPKQLWKIQVGPAWSSFAVAGRMLFTQEQRGPKEAVVCYDADSGKEIWKAEVDARLEDPMGGPGPRGTPTLVNGALYAMGSTGSFLRLDPSTGKIIWKKDVTQIAGSKVPMWGFASSPLVVGSLVIVYGGGPGDKGLLAFDAGNGELRWSAACPIDSYGSAQVNKISDEESVVVLTKAGVMLVDPATGKQRLEYEWKIPQYRALQPLVIENDTILLPTGMNMGTRAVQISKANGQYNAKELWTARQLSPDFVDLVSFKGYAYGNDGGLMTCIDLKTGKRQWKAGRYGKGQFLLLENSGLVLVLSEQGKVALVAADPADHKEIASFQAVEGKTWNHPVLVKDRLYLRNSQEAAAYKINLDL